MRRYKCMQCSIEYWHTCSDSNAQSNVTLVLPPCAFLTVCHFYRQLPVPWHMALLSRTMQTISCVYLVCIVAMQVDVASPLFDVIAPEDISVIVTNTAVAAPAHAARIGEDLYGVSVKV